MKQNCICGNDCEAVLLMFSHKTMTNQCCDYFVTLAKNETGDSFSRITLLADPLLRSFFPVTFQIHPDLKRLKCNASLSSIYNTFTQIKHDKMTYHNLSWGKHGLSGPKTDPEGCEAGKVN